MTREEAIDLLGIAVPIKAVTQEEFGRFIEAVNIAIEALEQEPKTDVLDKIRAEILVLDDADYDYEGYYKAVTDALQIIDKYRQEG